MMAARQSLPATAGVASASSAAVNIARFIDFLPGMIAADAGRTPA
jgi:hypothetical protein